MKKKYGVDPRGFFPDHTSGRPNESTDEPPTARPGGEGSLDCSNEGARGGEGEENGRAAGEGGMGNGGVEALVEAADTRGEAVDEEMAPRKIEVEEMKEAMLSKKREELAVRRDSVRRLSIGPREAPQPTLKEGLASFYMFVGG